MKIFEYRGVEGLVYAPVTNDDNTETGYTTGTVKPLAGVATISKSTDSANEAHYYDNLPAVVVSSTGSDTITITASAIPLDVLADITGQYYDETTGMFVEKERTPKYFAIGYQTKTTDGDVMYVWRLKGTFNIPDETNNTENAGTDANGQEITYTGISTTHKFTKTNNTAAKAVTVNTGLGLANVTNFFDSVQTPDTIEAVSPTPVTTPSVTLNKQSESVAVGSTVTLSATTVPADAVVTWSSSASEYATVAAGVVTGVAEGSATITATITVDGQEYSDSCAVSVTAAQEETPTA